MNSLVLKTELRFLFHGEEREMKNWIRNVVLKDAYLFTTMVSLGETSPKKE